MSLLQVSGTGKDIAETFALTDIHFIQQAGQKIGIAGATGSGKSTLLKLISGLDDADSGSILFEGRKVKGPAYRLIPGEPGIAYLSQHYELRNHYRMEELLSYANTLTEEEAMQLFRICRIDHLLQRKTSQLSGGEKQRIALARLLLQSPRLLLLDEPFSNLDLIHKTLLKQVLEELALRKGLSCIIASHDPVDLLPWADTLLILEAGKLLQQDTPETVYHRPVNVYAGALLGHYNLVPAAVAAQWGITTASGRQLFLRPEQLKPTVKGKGIAAVVEQVRFGGAQYELVVDAAGTRLYLAVPHTALKAGQTLYITVKEHDFWFL